MNRRRSARPEMDYGPEAEGGAPRYARRKSGNEGLYIALGSAGVVGIVFLLIILGGSSESEMNYEAQAVLRDFFRHCIANDEEKGMRMLEPREVLRDQNPNDIKDWRTLPADRKQVLARQSFRWLRGMVTGKNDLNLSDPAQIETILASADYFTQTNRVDVQWIHLGSRWNAVLEQRGDVWVILRLDKTGD